MNNKFSLSGNRLFKRVLPLSPTLLSLFAILFFAGHSTLHAQTNDDNDLINEYIKSMGYGDIIAFDASNIKLFWVDKSVMGKNDLIQIDLGNTENGLHESIAFPIQLANVDESQKCKIDIITKDANVGFSIMEDNGSIPLSKSVMMQDFIQYHTASASFNLEDTGLKFKLIFSSKDKDVLAIKKIVLSFSKNENWKPKTVVNISEKDLTGYNLSPLEDHSFTATGFHSQLLLKDFLPVSDNVIRTFVKIQNTGNVPTKTFIGFIIYAEDKSKLDGKNYPYKSINDILTVVSSEDGSNSIIVDKMPQWIKNCHLAINAKEDLSDIPNTSLAEGKIVEVKKLPNGQSEIMLDKPFVKALEVGTKVRIHDLTGYYLYTDIRILQPGEEALFTARIKKDDNFFQYSPKAFSKGVFYVKPLILSYSELKDSENTICIRDYSISY